MTNAFVLGYFMPSFFVFSFLLLYIYHYYQQYFVVIIRDLKRLMSVSFSPIVSLLSESLAGEAVIRVFTQTERFSYFNYENIQYNLKTIFHFRYIHRWLSTRLEIFGATSVLFIATLCCFFMVTASPINFGMVDMLMAYAIQLSNTFMWLITFYTQVQTDVVSIERVKEYCEIISEAPRIISYLKRGLKRVKLPLKTTLPLIKRNLIHL